MVARSVKINQKYINSVVRKALIEDISPNADEITKGELQDEAKRLVTLLTLSMKQIERDEAAGGDITPEVFGSQFGRVIADTTDIQKKLTQSSRDVKNVFDKIRALEQKEIAQKQKLATATDQLINSMSQASLSLLTGQYQKTKESETADLRNILGKSRTAKGTNMIPGLVAQARAGANLQQIEQSVRRSNRGAPQEQRLTDAQIQDAANQETIVRSRGDMTMHTHEPFEHDPHIDFSFKNISTILYINDSSGDTIFYKERVNEYKDIAHLKTLHEKDKVTPKANRLVLFEGDYVHTGSSPHLHKNRILINSNFINGPIPRNAPRK